jgi:hypothetical protein
MGDVRLSVNIGRVKGVPHRPETAIPGARITEVHPSWVAAFRRGQDLVQEAKREGGPVIRLTVTAIEIADRNYEHGKGSRDG